jgi:hypothetical protein
MPYPELSLMVAEVDGASTRLKPLGAMGQNLSWGQALLLVAVRDGDPDELVKVAKNRPPG